MLIFRMVFLPVLLVTLGANFYARVSFANQLPVAPPVAPGGHRALPLFDRAVTAAREADILSAANRRALFRWLNISEVELEAAQPIVRAANNDGVYIMTNKEIENALKILKIQPAEWLSVPGLAMLGTLCRLWMIDSKKRDQGNPAIYSDESWALLFQELQQRADAAKRPEPGWFIPVRFGESNEKLAQKTTEFLQVTRPDFYERAVGLVSIYPDVDPHRQIRLEELLKGQIFESMTRETFPNDVQSFNFARDLMEFYFSYSTPEEKVQLLEPLFARVMKEMDRHQSLEIRKFADSLVALTLPNLKNAKGSESIERFRRNLRKEIMSGYWSAKTQLRVYDSLRGELHREGSSDKNDIKLYQRFVDGWIEAPFSMTDAKTISYLQTYLSLMNPSEAVRAATTWMVRILSEDSKTYVQGSLSPEALLKANVNLANIMAMLLQFACDHAPDRQRVLIDIMKPYVNSQWFGYTPDFEKELMKNIPIAFYPTDPAFVKDAEKLLNEIVITQPSMKSLTYLRIFFNEISWMAKTNPQLGTLFRTVYAKNAVTELHYAIDQFEHRVPQSDSDSLEKSHYSLEQTKWIDEHAAFCVDLLLDVRSQFYALTADNFQKQYRNFLNNVASYGSTKWSSVESFEQTMLERQNDHIEINAFYQALLDELHPKLAPPARVQRLRLVYSSERSCARDLTGNLTISNH